MRYQSLDHWRGVAALAVVIFHGFGGIRSAGLEVHDSVQWMKSVSDFGWFGVHLFFVISGFCIAANVSILWRKGEGAWAFLEDRFLRIYPVYWLACLVALASNLAASPLNKVPWRTYLPDGWDGALANIFLVEPYFGYEAFLTVSWTLVYEIGFYILVGAGVALCRAGLNKWLLFAAALALAVWGLSVPHYGATYVLNFWPEFLLGAAVYLALVPGSPRRALWIVVPAVLAGVGCFTLEPAARVYQMLGATAFAYVLYFLYPWDAKIAGWKALHWLAWVGVISYSLYLTHAFLGLRIINLSTRLFDHTSPWHLVLHPVAWIFAVFTAWLFYRWCELPVDSFRRRVKKRRQLREGEGTSSGSPPTTA
jgi:peptidoglycan/LPS O-acetylase OafA/YrhL